MPEVPQSTEQEFNTSWSKAVAWANSQGISSASYLPVYQLDVNRIQNGEYPMSASERNLEILAAHNPNQVTPAPQDTPSSSLAPSNIMKNAVSDAGKIATGLAGIFTGSFEKQVWDSAKTTLHYLTDPGATIQGGMGGTIGNWLDNTLLAYLPGATDIGQVLQADPTLTGDQGAKKLLQHPLVSLLDLLGAGEGGVVAELGERGALGDAGRSYAASTAEQGGLLHQLGGVKFGKGGGLSLRPGETALVDQLSIGDRIAKMAARIGPGGAGVGPAIADMAEVYSTSTQMAASQFDWLMEGPARAAKGLNEEQVELLSKIIDAKDKTMGESVRRALDDPTLDPQVKDALVQMIDGPLRFAIEGQLISGDLHPIQPLWGGKEGMYLPTEAAHSAVFDALKARDAARVAATHALGRLSGHVDKVAALEAELVNGTKQFMDRLSAARQAVAADQIPHDNATQDLVKPTRFRKKLGISKSAEVRVVVDEGGLADQVLDRIKDNHDPVQIRAVAKAIKSRLSKWGAGSVDAAEVPTLAALAATADALVKWADMYQKEGEAIDKDIHGEVETQRGLFNQHAERREIEMKALRARHVTDKANLVETFEKRLSKVRNTFSEKLARNNQWYQMVVQRVETDGDAAAERATAKVLRDEIMPKVRSEIAVARENNRNAIAAARKAFLSDSKAIKLEKDNALLKLAKKQRDEIAEASKTIRTEKLGMGDVMREVVGYAKAVDKFQQAVADHPSDEYRDVKVMLMQKHMLAHEHSADLIGQTLKHADEVGMPERQIAKLRTDQQLLGEYMVTRFSEIFLQPTVTPEVAEMAQKALRESATSGMEELKLLIRQGLAVQYIPTATDIDAKLTRDAVRPIIGHGIPKPDMAKAKVWDMTPQLNDFAVGIKKAAIQQLQRDAVIEMTEHYLKPMTLTKAQVANFIDKNMAPLDRSLGGNLAQESRHMTAESLGLTAFKPESLFGFRMPRWGHDEVYLPTSIVHALENLMDQKGQNIKLLSSSTKVFRYSILGLSPRYTAHVTFGGTMMAALRVSPYALGFIGDAAKALRDGELPDALRGRHAIEEGGQRDALSLFQRQGGKDIGNEVVTEHIEQRQGIARAAAKPIHVLRALADVNFRFTRYVRDLQAAVVYLDGAAKAERRNARLAIEDPVTGKTVHISPDRSAAEGMKAVQSVYGNLGRMAPFERQVAQTMMPFYGWQKHILGYVMTFPFDHPWRSVVLSQLAFNSSQDVPLAYPIRLQLLYFLGSPDSQGNVNAIDIRSLDPFRDVANYASWTGFFEALNPAISAPLAMAFGPDAIYGNSSLYPTVSYNSFYGIETANSGGNLLTGLSQWIPQIGAAQSALTAAAGIRSTWNTDRSAAIKSMLESLNIPFVTPPVNLKQIAAKDEGTRFEVAKTAAYNAFSTGDFSSLAGYTTVPNPLNPAYDITPAALAALYKQAQVASPGVAPIESLLPPPTPYGW